MNTDGYQVFSILQRRFSRRRVLSNGAAMAVGPILLARGVLAHDTRNLEISDAISRYAEQAADLEFLYYSITEDTRWRLDKDLAPAAKTISFQLLGIVSSLPPGDARLYVRNKYLGLTQAMEARDIPLVPDKAEFEQAQQPSSPIDWTDKEENKPSEEGLLAILFDIVVGGFFPKGAVQLWVIKKMLGNAELRASMENLSKAVKQKNWNSAGRHLRKVIDTLTSPKMLKLLETLVGKKQAARLLVHISSRFVPFVGQALLVGGMIHSIWNEWDRLSTYIAKI